MGVAAAESPHAPTQPMMDGEAPDVIAMLQEELEIDRATAQDFASIQVKCTAPGRTDESSLGDFLAMNHGGEEGSKEEARAAALGVVRDIATEAKGRTIRHLEKGLVMTLGRRAVVRDEDIGGLARVRIDESKKK